MNRPLTIAAAVLLVAGLLVGGLQTAGFERVSADRQVDVDVADEDSAYLAVSDQYGGQTVRNALCFFFGCFQFEQPRAAADLENRFTGEYSTVQASVTSVQNAPDETLEVRGTPGQLAAGGTGGFEIGCTGDRRAEGQGDVTVTIRVTGSAIAIDTQTVIEGVEYNCYVLN
jgi:hypothetical protein